MKLVLMGTNDWVVPIFDYLSQKHEILAVFTVPPKPSGRKLNINKSPVHIWAENLNLKIHTNIDDYNYNPDFIIVISYGVILPENIFLSTNCINLHPSLLPKYRGASPIKTAIINGDTETGVCIIDVVKDVDSGGIHIKEKINIDINDNFYILEKKIITSSINLLKLYLNNPAIYPAIKQEGEVIYSKKIKKEDSIIDWNQKPIEIHNKIRAIGGRTNIKNMDIKIIETLFINDELYITKIQPAGKKIMLWKDFKNGYRELIKEGFYCVKI